MEFIKKTKQCWDFIVKYKYYVVIGIFAFWLLLGDQYSILVDQLPMWRKKHKLEKEKIYYINKIREDSTMLNELKTNDANLIKFARERYFMKADDEDVFIIEETE